MRPVICMVTSIVHSKSEQDGLIERVEAAARGGVDIIQIRQPHMEGGALTRLVRAALAVTNGTAARVLVNDRVDVALAAGAHGVHLRGVSVDAQRVRSVAPPGFVIGRSVHLTQEGVGAAGSGALDYLLFGTVFETASKRGVEPAGVARLAHICSSVPVPVLGVGGMEPGRLGAVAAAGAAGFAAIGLFADATLDRLPAIVAQSIAAFDPRSSTPSVSVS